ncbi:MAG: YHS domain-containing (seleno)protein [Casimicrobiaceae bacterium]
MNLLHKLQRLVVLAVVAGAALMAAGCASNRVISDGPHHNLMLKGFDPVAYFTDGKPVPGKVDIAVQHDGLDYRFVSEEHRKMFLADPQHYVPKYGGFCAQGVAYAVMFGGEAEKFQIINDRLFIYGDQGAIDAWNSSPKKHLEYAEHYWETEMKGMPYRLQTAKRFILKVAHYKTGKEVHAALDAGKPVLE